MSVRYASFELYQTVLEHVISIRGTEQAERRGAPGQDAASPSVRFQALWLDAQSSDGPKCDNEGCRYPILDLSWAICPRCGLRRHRD